MPPVAARVQSRVSCKLFRKKQKKVSGKNVKRINDARKELYRNYRLALHVENDAEVIEQLDKKENVTGYIRQLVLRDIKTDSVKE